MKNLSIRTQLLIVLLIVEVIAVSMSHYLIHTSVSVLVFELILAILLALVISHRLSASIIKLSEKVQEFNGDKVVMIPTKLNSKEIQNLANTIQNMQQNIVKNKYQIHRQINTINKYVITSTTDLEGVITNVSEAYCRISMYRSDELVGKSHNIVRHPDTPISIYQNLWDTLKKGNTWSGQLHNKNKIGQSYWLDATITPIKDDENKCIGYYSISYDITAEKQAQILATTDALTQIPNRLKLDEVLRHEISIMKRYKTIFSVILVDVDYFKLVNDNFGHSVGDDILKEITQRLSKNLRDCDTLGRWGGEEFLIICPNTCAKDASDLAEQLRKEIHHDPFPVVGQKSASFGVAETYEKDNFNSIIDRADQALYEAKKSGRNKVINFNI